MWSKAKFINRKFMIEDLYAKFQEGETTEVDQNTDPFWDPIEDIFLGRLDIFIVILIYYVKWWHIDEDDDEIC